VTTVLVNLPSEIVKFMGSSSDDNNASGYLKPICLVPSCGSQCHVSCANKELVLSKHMRHVTSLPINLMVALSFFTLETVIFYEEAANRLASDL
jgi:hypothetical protein